MKIKIALLLSAFMLINYNVYSQVVSSSGTTVRYTEQLLGKDFLGIPNVLKLVEISTFLKNNSDKVITKIYFTVFFRNKLYSSSDITAPNKLLNSEANVNIIPKYEVNVKFTVLQPDDINMVYQSAGIEKVIYSDGSNIDF